MDRTHNLPVERRTLYNWAIAAPAKCSSPMPRCHVMLSCAVIGVARGAKGAIPPQILRKYSHFVFWEAFLQTKLCYSRKSKHFGPPNFWAGYATVCSWDVTEEPTIREKELKASLDVYLPWFHAKPFLSDFERKDKINCEQPEPQRLLICCQMSACYSAVESLSFVQWTFEWDGGNGFVCREGCRKWGTIAPQVNVLAKHWFQDKHRGTSAYWIWPRFWKNFW